MESNQDHDYLKFQSTPKLHGIVDNEQILFSDNIKKINQNSWTQTRIFVITTSKIFNISGTKIKRQIDLDKVGGISRTVAGKASEFTIHVPSEYDYRFNSQKRDDIIKILQTQFYKLKSSNVPIYDCNEKDLKGFTTTEKDKKRGKDNTPTSHFRNFSMDLFKEEKLDDGDMEIENSIDHTNIEQDTLNRQKGVFNKTLKDNEKEKAADLEDDQEIAMSMVPGKQKDGIESQTSAALEFIKEENEEAKLEDFKIVKMVGKGTFGKVFLVQLNSNKKFYAMKTIRKDVVLENENIDSLKLEKEILYTVRHPFIVSMDYVFQNQFRIFFIMDFVEGGELFRHLVKNRRFREDQAKYMIAQIAIAIGHLHSKNIVYRDLKPENVLLKKDGNILLADFGLATQLSKDKKMAHSFCGTPEYLAPEMLANQGHDHTIDWWTLGILLYEIIVGIPPFFHKNKHRMYYLIQEAKVTFPNIEKHGISVTPEAQDFINSLLEKKKDNKIGKGGIDEILKHEFFKDLDIEKLMKGELEPPYKPEIKDGEFENFNTYDQIEHSMVQNSQQKLIQQNDKMFKNF